MSSTRAYQNSAPQPFSPAMTTASSLNYSAYGAGGAGPGAVAGSSSYGWRSAPVSASAQKLQAIGIGRSESGLSQGSKSGRSETRETARVHWRALREFLAQWLKDGMSCRAANMGFPPEGQGRMRWLCGMRCARGQGRMGETSWMDLNGAVVVRLKLMVRITHSPSISARKAHPLDKAAISRVVDGCV